MQADPSIQKRPRPRPSGPSTKSSWGIGDIARVTVDGIEREVTFASKLKDGRGRYLVMADPETRKELFGSDGETELPLPPFSTSSLVKRGSRNPVEAALLRVHAYWDLPPFQLSDLERPELADYFAQFSNIPDEGDDLSTLEKAGFKPPEYFIRRYSGPGTANPSQDEPTRTAPLSSPLNRPAPSRALATTDPSNDREITDTAPLSSPPECPEASVESKCTMAFSPSDPPFGHSAVGASDEVERVPKDHGANDAAPLLDSEELGAVEAGTGKVNDGGVGEEQEESEEEEVENVLGSKRMCDTETFQPNCYYAKAYESRFVENSAGKPKPKKKATSAKGKGKSSEGQEKTGEAILLKGAPKPRKDYGPAKRSSARLQSGPSALSPLTPTAARRTSQRAKQETNQPQAPATRRTSQRNKPDVSSAPVNQLANPSTRSRGK